MGWGPVISLAVSVGSQLLLGLFQKSPKQDDPVLQMPKSDYGVGIPKIYGRVRLEGNKFFPQTKELMYEIVNKRSGRGGKGGLSQKKKEKKVYGSIALLYCEGKTKLEKIIIQGDHIGLDHPFYQSYCTWFDGTQDSVWSVVGQDISPYNLIKYKNVAFLGIERMPLDNYGNQIPSQIAAILVDDVYGPQPTLEQVVGDMLTRANIDSSLWDVTDLASIRLRDGMTVKQSGESYRESIETLMELYLFAPFRDTDGKIVFRKIKRGDDSVVSLSNKYFIPTDNDGSYITDIKSDFELPTKLSIKFFNNSRVYESDEVNVFLGNKAETDNNVKILSETLTTYPYEAEERARDVLAYLYSIEKNSYKFKLPIWYYSQFNCLDVVTLPNGQTVQITKINIGADYTIDLEANFYDSVTSSYVSTPDTAMIPPVLTNPSIPSIFIVDAPVIDHDLPGSLYCFATSGPAVIEVSDNGGDSWDYAVTHNQPSIIGNCLTVIDSTLSVELISGSGLESITADEFSVDMGHNLCFVGRQTTGGYYEGEFIQFQDVSIIGVNQYTLSTLKRGLNNTGNYSHVSGEKFFLFKGVGSYYSVIPGNASFIGLSLLFRPIVSDWQNLATTPITGITPVGNSYKPPAPTNATGTIDKDGNIQLFWDYNPSFSPYDNSQKAVTFEVEIFKPDTSYRLLATPSKDALYLVDDRTDDGVVPPLSLIIYGISSVVGRGYPLEAEVTPVLVPDTVFGTGGGLKGSKFIYADYTILEEDNQYLLIVVNPNATTITLTFSTTLSNGFICYVVNSEVSNTAAKVLISCPYTYTGEISNTILNGFAVSVNHISLGNYFVLGNGSQSLQLDAVINITGDQTLEANKFYEVIGPATLTFPANPIEGSIIGIVDSPGTFDINPVVLDGNGKTIEGSSSFLLNKPDENIQFYYNGFQWIYIARFYYVDVLGIVYEASRDGFLIAGTNITLDYDDIAETITINSSGGGGGSASIEDIWLYGE